MFAVHSCFHQIPNAALVAIVDIAAVWICLAGGATFPCYSRWRFFEPQLIGKSFIQGIEIALHTLFHFYFYIDPAFS